MNLDELERLADSNSIFRAAEIKSLIAEIRTLREALEGVLDDLDEVGRLMGFYDIKKAHKALAGAK